MEKFQVLWLICIVPRLNFVKFRSLCVSGVVTPCTCTLQVQSKLLLIPLTVLEFKFLKGIISLWGQQNIKFWNFPTLKSIIIRSCTFSYLKQRWLKARRYLLFTFLLTFLAIFFEIWFFVTVFLMIIMTFLK